MNNLDLTLWSTQIIITLMNKKYSNVVARFFGCQNSEEPIIVPIRKPGKS